MLTSEIGHFGGQVDKIGPKLALNLVGSVDFGFWVPKFGPKIGHFGGKFGSKSAKNDKNGVFCKNGHFGDFGVFGHFWQIWPFWSFLPKVVSIIGKNKGLWAKIPDLAILAILVKNVKNDKNGVFCKNGHFGDFGDFGIFCTFCSKMDQKRTIFPLLKMAIFAKIGSPDPKMA